MFNNIKLVKKMDCKEIKFLLSIYENGELKGTKLGILKNHLHKCENCKKEYEFLTILNNDLKTNPEIEVPINFTARVMEKVKAKKEKKLVSIFSTSAVYTTVFILFLVFGVFLNTDSVTNKNGNSKNTEYFSDFLAQSQEMNVMPVSDKIFEMFANGTSNEE